MKCVVQGCTNHDEDGWGMWLNVLWGNPIGPDLVWVCWPCWGAFKEGAGFASEMRSRSDAEDWRQKGKESR